MNVNRAKAEWKNLKGKARVRWGRLTGNDRALARGNRDQIEAAVERRYAIAKYEVKRQMDRLGHSLKRALEPGRWSLTR